jgi:hypothetical protein
MEVAELATTVRDAITVSRVFAEPYEKDGVTVIAAATVAGGAGGGGGHDERGQEGEGGGFGVSARLAARTSSRTAGCGGARRSTSTGSSPPSARSPSPTCSPVSASRRRARPSPATRLIGLEGLSNRAPADRRSYRKLGRKAGKEVR